MSRASLILEKQWLHAAGLAVLLGGMAWFGGFASVRAGRLLGFPTPAWFWIAVGLAIAHQVYVASCWRIQLHASGVTRVLGDYGFPAYAVGFSVLGLARAAAVFLVAISNRGTLPGGAGVLRGLAVVALVPAAYVLYSVGRYFGFARACGIDHFDPAYRSIPFERRGIFRFTRNGMYVFGFLLLWAPALWWASLAALGVAMFNHVYIWVHYFATERPDMERIYGVGRLAVRDRES